jgi:DNA-binding ferritin-like protein (Dps family)
MGKIFNKILGDLSEKKAYKQNEKRAKALPAEYAEAYKNIKHYIFSATGILTMEPLKVLVDMLEEAAAEGKHVIDITGADVAAFADELVRGEHSYFDQQRKKLNKSFSKKGK